ncbi:hypothetical protein M407DRAFT_23957 [Tulasnella calospora MUT 4182]|uniref:Major facilitator superfamily (MFS) profile domain-containing protein n=1 Tax=Tulasnella calospora MUT 4182 TaxID=1051891 RepID=A0A0C3LZB9_9AGAM|nr:hypothetical protein M407DRAFT_23957 [Tulasnella calospora MUT 4182]
MDPSEDDAQSAKDIESQPILRQKGADTPLSKTQLAVVLFARMAEPISYSQIIPYINAMIEEMRIASPNEVGFYSGLIDSVAALLQLCTLVYWGSLSDRIGRKPVLLIGLLGISVSTLCFGLSNTLWQMILFRGLNAALCGNSPVFLSIMSDITDTTNQHKVFPLAGLTWYGGELAGSLIGGLLSHPADKYPALFGSVTLLRTRPFLLPCLVSSLYTSVTIVATTTLLEESHPHVNERAPHNQDLSTPPESRSYASCQNNDLKGRPTTTSRRSQTLRLLSNTIVRYLLFARFLRDLLTHGFGKVFVLWSYTPLRLGGLQRSPAAIGMMLGVAGVLGVFASNVLFPILYRRSNSVALFAACMSIWGLVFPLVPLVSLTVKKVLPIPQEHDHAPPLGGLWGLVLLLMVLQKLAVMSYRDAFLLMVNEAVLDPASAGALFALATTAGTLGGAVAPVFTTTLFAVSMERGLLGGNLVWILMTCLSILATLFAQSLKRRL